MLQQQPLQVQELLRLLKRLDIRRVVTTVDLTNSLSYDNSC